MRVIGLTGSIACGKSTVSRYLISLGFPVVDGDQISRELTAPGSPVLDEIRYNFGDRFINDNGNLNRRALGTLIFRDEHARSRLDAVMAPHLKRVTLEKIAQHRAEGADLCFLDMPLLFEKGYDSLCDSVWTVWLPEDIQLSRLMARDHLSEEEALNRIRSVMSSDEKASRADYVIDNSGPVRHMLTVVDRLLQSELAPVSPVSPAHSAAFRPNSGVISNESRPDDVPPEVMERPEAAKRRPSARKADWESPLWMKVSLIAVSLLLAVCITAYALMKGYLVKQQEIHRDEQDEISWRYHFEDYETVYRNIVEQYAAEFNLRPAFVAAVIMAESSFRPDVNSNASARGLMQLLEGTASDRARELGISTFSFEMVYDPGLNIRLGCAHLKYLVKKFGNDLTTVMVAYNVGEGNVKRNWLSNPDLTGGGTFIQFDQIPDRDVKEYVRVVNENYGIYQKKFYSDTSPDRTPDSVGSSAL